MSFSDIALLFRWLVPLWLLGWLILPVSRRLFPFLPDEGLAVGRVGALVAGSLLAFWSAQIGWLPLSVGVWFVPALLCGCAWQWRKTGFKNVFRANKTAFVLSDLVFLLAFLVFVWVRLRHPSLNDLEKPMDLALLSSSARADYLPFEHFWFAGVPFTNYYAFGPFMGGMLARLLGTSAPLAYNLVQPLFCALFLSSLWSLGGALTRSKWLGLGVMALVGLGGHLEPLRQLAQKTPLSQLDWWKTSRVIEHNPLNPDTINEYPAFTMLIGDAHAHFYALCLAMMHFCVCLGIVSTDSRRVRGVLVLLGGAMIGVFALANTWDVPFYGVLWALCTFYAHRKDRLDRGIGTMFLWGLVAAVGVAGPFFARFQSQVGGGGFALWMPEPFGFALFWGVWIALGVVAWGLDLGKIAPSRESDFRRLLLVVGILALLFPSIYYVGGVFAGGEQKHQDTVFKFYLQAWLLGGTAIGSEALLRFAAWQRASTWRGGHIAERVLGASAVIFLLAMLSLAPWAVWHARTQLYGEPGLSLDGAQWLPQSDRKAVEWLSQQNGIIAERLPSDNGGDYDANRGTMGTFSGLPQMLCWPGHVRAWGFQNAQTRAARVAADSVNAQVGERIRDLNALYTADSQTRKTLAQKYGISFLVVRPGDPPFGDPNFGPHEFVGDDGSKTVILERQGF